MRLKQDFFAFGINQAQADHLQFAFCKLPEVDLHGLWVDHRCFLLTAFKLGERLDAEQVSVDVDLGVSTLRL